MNIQLKQTLSCFILIFVLGCQANNENLSESEYVKTSIESFGTMGGEVDFWIMLSEIKPLPKDAIATITFENTIPGEPPLVIKEPAVFERKLKLDGRYFEIMSPKMRGATPNKWYTIEFVFTAKNNFRTSHVEKIQITSSAKELREYEIQVYE